jgi:chromosome segregation ATPase
LFGGLKQDATQVELLGHFPVFGDGVSKTTLPATSSPVTSQTEKVLALEESLKKTEKGLAVAQEQIKTVNDKLTTTLNQARKAAARVEELERQIASLEKEKLDLNMAKATMEKTCEDLTVKSQLLESFKEGYSQLQHELDRVQAKYNELQGTCNDAVVERDDLQERINTMTLAEKSSTDREPDSPTSRLEPVLPHSARPTSTSDLDRLDGLIYYWERQLIVKKALVEETTANIMYFDSEISKTQHHVRQARKPAQSATSSNQRFDVGLKTLVDGGDASAEEDATKQDTGPVKPSRIPDSVARTNGMNWASAVGGNTTFQSPPQQANNNAGSAVEEEWPAPAHGEASVNTMKLRRRG